MALYYRLNAKFQDPDFTPEPGDIFEECNFAQPHSNVAIFNGIKDLVFIRCNLANCIVHASSKFKQNQSGKYDYCKHIMPHLPIADEVDNCRHTTDFTDPENPVRDTIYLGKHTQDQLTDEEVVAVFAPYNDIRKDRNGWQRWLSNG